MPDDIPLETDLCNHPFRLHVVDSLFDYSRTSQPAFQPICLQSTASQFARLSIINKDPETIQVEHVHLNGFGLFVLSTERLSWENNELAGW